MTDHITTKDGRRVSLDLLREAAEKATPGPYFFDSYWRVMSSPKCKEHLEWSKANIPEDLDDPNIDWKRLAAEEPQITVCGVRPYGSTAQGQASIDADYFAAVSPDVVLALLDAVQQADVRAREECAGRIKDLQQDYHERPQEWAALNCAVSVIRNRSDP